MAELRNLELRLVGRDGDVGGGREREAETERLALHDDEDRRVRLAHQPVGAKHDIAHVAALEGVHAGGTRRAHGRTAHAKVRARAANDDQPRLALLALDDVAEFADHRVGHAIARVGAVDGDFEDLALVARDQFAAHAFLRRSVRRTPGPAVPDFC